MNAVTMYISMDSIWSEGSVKACSQKNCLTDFYGSDIRDLKGSSPSHLGAIHMLFSSNNRK